MAVPRKEIVEEAMKLVPRGANFAYLMYSKRHVTEPAPNHKEGINVLVFYDGVPGQDWVPIPWPSDIGEWFQRATPSIVGNTRYSAGMLVTNGTKSEGAKRAIREGELDTFYLPLQLSSKHLN